MLCGDRSPLLARSFPGITFPSKGMMAAGGEKASNSKKRGRKSSLLAANKALGELVLFAYELSPWVYYY